jgi:hypothetical protein
MEGLRFDPMCRWVSDKERWGNRHVPAFLGDGVCSGRHQVLKEVRMWAAIA